MQNLELAQVYDQILAARSAYKAAKSAYSRFCRENGSVWNLTEELRAQGEKLDQCAADAEEALRLAENSLTNLEEKESKAMNYQYNVKAYFRDFVNEFYIQADSPENALISACNAVLHIHGMYQNEWEVSENITIELYNSETYELLHEADLYLQHKDGQTWVDKLDSLVTTGEARKLYFQLVEQKEKEKGPLQTYTVRYDFAGGELNEEVVEATSPREAAEAQNYCDGPGEWEVEVEVYNEDGELVHSTMFADYNLV